MYRKRVNFVYSTGPLLNCFFRNPESYQRRHPSRNRRVHGERFAVLGGSTGLGLVVAEGSFPRQNVGRMSGCVSLVRIPVDTI